MLVNTVKGTFGKASGTAIFAKRSPEDAAFDLSVKTASIDTDNEKRDEHLKSEDFFDVEKHPEIRIKSDKVYRLDDTTFQLQGTLAMIGVEKPLEVEFSISEETVHSITLFAEFTISREDFGLGSDYGGFMVSDEIEVFVRVVVE